MSTTRPSPRQARRERMTKGVVIVMAVMLVATLSVPLISTL